MDNTLTGFFKGFFPFTYPIFNKENQKWISSLFYTQLGTAEARLHECTSRSESVAR